MITMSNIYLSLYYECMLIMYEKRRSVMRLVLTAECKMICEFEKRAQISLVRETEFFIIILSRAIETLDGYQLDENQIISTNDVYIRYEIDFLKI